jgi:diguanylate cyclase (GGDEF)-like protein
MLLVGGAALALTALAFGLFWFGYAFPRHHHSYIDQIEIKAMQVARLFEAVVGTDALIDGALPAASARLIEEGRSRAGLLKVRVFDAAGVIIHSSTPDEIGTVNEYAYFRERVTTGNLHSKLVKTDQVTLERDRLERDVVETYVPVMEGDLFIGAFEIYLDVTEDLAALHRLTTDLNARFLLLVSLLMLLFIGLLRHGYRVALAKEREQNLQLQHEIDHRRRVEQQLRENQQRFDHMAHHDPLTGLANRRLFTAHLDHALALALRERSRLAVMFLDLDRFKTVNDSLGHETGDRLLVEVSRRLQLALRQTDTLARMGGDEFAILLEGVVDDLQVSNLAERVLRVLEPPVRVGEFELKAGASIGIAVAFSDGTTADELLKNADTAMYRAKERGRGTSEYYMPELNARAQVRLLLEGSIAHAIDRGELELYYQPQFLLADGSLHGAEALLRWNHHDLGTISPAEFIPIAEETGLIVRIGEWVLREACRQARRWHDRGHPRFTIAVNLSARQFRDHALLQKVCSALAETGLPPRSLELELTESLVMEHPEESIELLRKFHDLGISLAIDDFGTGYSSLNYLRKFPINRLKVDRSFVSDIDDPDDARIVATIVNLAHGLDLEVVAEGIEQQSQLAFLRQRGCALGQGYLFSPPVPAAAFNQLLRDYATHGAVPAAGWIQGLPGMVPAG